MEVQDAVDREIGGHYRPGRERDGALIKLIFKRTKATAHANLPPAGVTLPETLVVASRFRVFFLEALREAIDERWHELEFSSVSAYLTSLIRYDLMLGGPHLYFDGEDTDPALLARPDAQSSRGSRALTRHEISQDVQTC